jgi:hypothetical protein
VAGTLRVFVDAKHYSCGAQMRAGCVVVVGRTAAEHSSTPLASTVLPARIWITASTTTYRRQTTL